MKLRQTVVCLILAAAIGSLKAQTPQTPVILISIDTLRADHLSAYGYTKVRTPNIDSFAEHGTLFTQADCQIPFTMPSHASMLTSTYPFENQVEENAVAIAPGAVTLATILHARGYKTAAFISTAFMEKQMGLDAGFDFYDSPFHYDAFSPMSGTMFLGATPGSPNAGKDRRDGALVVRSARQWLENNNKQPLFAFIHLFDMHKPYSNGYDGQLAYVDHLIGLLKQSLVQFGLWDKALVILAADHGESLGDHGESSHGYFIYESTLHVPLIIHWPADAYWPAGAENHPARVTDPVGLIDVAPTVMEFLRLPMPPSFEGASLFGAHNPVYGESVHAQDAFGWAPLRSLRAGIYKYIEAPRPELYNLQNDPHELTNIYVKGSPKAADLRNQLAKLLARYAPKKAAPTAAQSPAARALLDSLGYLSAGPRNKNGGSGADPKDGLPEFRTYEDAQLQLYHHQMTQAIATLRQLLVHDPHNTLARRDLGSTYLETGNFAGARTAFQQVLAAVPDDYMANYEIGLAEHRLGLLKEAKEHLETACRIAPESRQARNELDSVLKKLN